MANYTNAKVIPATTIDQIKTFKMNLKNILLNSKQLINNIPSYNSEDIFDYSKFIINSGEKQYFAIDAYDNKNENRTGVVVNINNKRWDILNLSDIEIIKEKVKKTFTASFLNWDNTIFDSKKLEEGSNVAENLPVNNPSRNIEVTVGDTLVSDADLAMKIALTAYKSSKKQFTFEDVELNNEFTAGVYTVGISNYSFEGWNDINVNINKDMSFTPHFSKGYSTYTMTVTHEEEQSDSPFVWEKELILPEKSAKLDYSEIGELADYITDDTANGGDDWDGSNRTIALYFVGAIRDGVEKRLDEPYLMEWYDPRSTQNTEMQEYLKANGFTPFNDAPAACYTINTDDQFVDTASYNYPLIFKLVRLKEPISNQTLID